VAFILCVAISSSLGPEAALIGSLVGFAVLLFGIIFSMALVGMISVPMELKAGTRQDLGAGFDVAFIKDFIRLTWKETLIGFLFLYFANFVLMIVGMLMLCIGVYFTMAISMMAQTHFEHQLYRLYLQRGGAPIPAPSNPSGQYPGRAPSGW
jgi:hypothetical protein